MSIKQLNSAIKRMEQDPTYTGIVKALKAIRDKAQEATRCITKKL